MAAAVIATVSPAVVAPALVRPGRAQSQAAGLGRCTMLPSIAPLRSQGRLARKPSPARSCVVTARSFDNGSVEEEAVHVPEVLDSDFLPVARSGDDSNSQQALSNLRPSFLSAVPQLGQKFAAFCMDVFRDVGKPAVAALLILALVAAIPDVASAASSGGRVGGRSFSSGGGGGGGASRSYSAPSRGSYSGGPSISAPSYSYSAPYAAPSPFFGGYGGYGGFSPFSMFYPRPTVVVAGGGGGGLFGGFGGLLLLGFFAFVVTRAVRGVISGGSDGSLLGASTKTSVVRLQVGLLGMARSLQKDLERLADRTDTSSPEGLQYILTEAVLSLMRHPDYCVYGRSTTDVKRSVEDGEEAFNQLSLEERGKFAEETLVSVGAVRRRMQRAPRSERFTSEYIVVTILVATEGELKLPAINSSSDLQAALSKLGAVPTEKIQAVEIMWTPQDENDTLTEREMLADYPSLRNL